MSQHTSTASAPSVETLLDDERAEADDYPYDAAPPATDAGAPSLAELHAAWAEIQRQRQQQQRDPIAASPPPQWPTKPAKVPDPYEPDEPVTLLLPRIVREIHEGIEQSDGSRVRQNPKHRVSIATEAPSDEIDELTGRRLRGQAVTLTFVGGVCRDVPYAVARPLKKGRMFRSDEALKIVANDTPETAFAALCGVQATPPNKVGALLASLSATDLDTALDGFSTDEMAVFAAALQRRVAAARAAGGGSQPVRTPVRTTASTRAG